MTNKIAFTTLMVLTVLAVAPAMALELGSATKTATAGQAVPPAGQLPQPVFGAAPASNASASALNAIQPAAGEAMTAGTVKVVEPVAAAAVTTTSAAMNGTVQAATEATVPMPAMPDNNAPVVQAPTPVLSGTPSAMSAATPVAPAAQATNAVIGATQTAADAPLPTGGDMARQPTPAIVAPLPPFNGGASGTMNASSPLCAPVAATTASDVTMPAQQPVVSPPSMIPLSVELADALGIKGFENIKADGPIGFITRDASGRVMFEGKDLTGNVQTLCASGQPIPAPGMPGAATSAMAPDGSAYSAMPGQKGFRMQPIVDGPNYKYPPKRKKAAAPKSVEVKEETLAPVETDKVKVESESGAAPAPAAPAAPETATPAASSSDVDSLKSMMREPNKGEAPAAPAAAPVAEPAPTSVMTAPVDAGAATPPAETGVIPAPTTDTSGEGAVGEILDNSTATSGTR